MPARASEQVCSISSDEGSTGMDASEGIVAIWELRQTRNTNYNTGVPQTPSRGRIRTHGRREKAYSEGPNSHNDKR